jgi:thiamine kinase-like enzyme
MVTLHGKKSLMHIDTIKRYKLFSSNIELFKPLENQGHSNLIYLLKTENKSYLVRKFQITLDRKAEFLIQKKAFFKNIAAEPILLDEKNGLMITMYLKGKHQTKLSQQKLKKIALLLKKLHKIKVRQKQNSFKENFTFKEKRVKHAFMVLAKEPKEYALGHNDLHAKNIIFSKNSIKLIDWEYARYSDIYFDLVSIIIEYKLNRRDKATFLRSYLGKKKVNHKKIEAYTLIYKELWRLWFEKLDKGEL